MNTRAVPDSSGSDLSQTANDRFKQSFGNWFWGSMITATVLHFVAFAFWPQMTAEDVSFNQNDMTTIDLPPEIEIPPPPEAIARPATPVVAETEIDEDITIAPTTFDENPVEDLPPPPTERTEDVSARPTFTPYDVPPKLLNPAEAQQKLQLEYPPLLRDAGIGGVVKVHLFIDEFGEVQDRRIDQSSGHNSLDQAALKVADVMEFAPAQNRDKNVKVWISQEITFTVR